MRIRYAHPAIASVYEPGCNRSAANSLRAPGELSASRFKWATFASLFGLRTAACTVAPASNNPFTIQPAT